VDEVQRIQSVYADYSRSDSVLRKHDSSNRGNIIIEAERVAEAASLLRTWFPTPLERCRVLDIGCGRGDFLHWLHQAGVPAGNLLGVDLLAERVELARQTYPELTFQQANAEEIDFPERCFNIVVCFAVFSSILDPAMARNVAATAARMLADDGVILWWDMRYRNPVNPNVRPMTRRRIRALFPDHHVLLRSTTLLPPLARHLGPHTSFLYSRLVRLPPLRSHNVGVVSRFQLRPLEAEPRPSGGQRGPEGGG
jgi:2-polyprenyl-3-methyl-5-hydroxy-6-metoxy-1,4-benzoquinol methylase